MLPAKPSANRMKEHLVHMEMPCHRRQATVVASPNPVYTSSPSIKALRGGIWQDVDPSWLYTRHGETWLVFLVPERTTPEKMHWYWRFAV